MRTAGRVRGVVVLLVTALGAVTGAFRLTGGRWFIMRTPSMGTTAPVGTLVVTRPVAVSAVRVGDVVTCRPPLPDASYYTHRVVAVTAAGITTRGDLNGAADPWTLRTGSLVGRAVLIVPAAGWLLLTGSILVCAVALACGLTRRVRRGPGRRLVRLAAVLAVNGFVLARLHPFTGVTQLASTVDGHGVARISVVSTGLLPVRLTAEHGQATPVVLTYGHHAMVTLTGLSPGDTYVLGARLHLGWAATLLLIAGWLAVTLAAAAAVNRPGRGVMASRHRWTR